MLFGEPPNIEALKAKRNVDGLIKALGYQKDAGVRQAASEALGELKDPRAVTPLIAALTDESWSVHEAAATALVKIGAPSVEPLIAALKDNNSSTQGYAARALGQIGDGRAIEPLTATLQDGNEWVRQNAAEALKTLEAKRKGEIRRFRVLAEFGEVIWEGYDFHDAVRRAGYEPQLEGILRLINHVEEITEALNDADKAEARSDAASRTQSG